MATADGIEQEGLVLDGGSGVRRLARGPNGLLCMLVGGRILAWDSHSSNQDPIELMAESATAICSSPDGSYLAASVSPSGASQVGALPELHNAVYCDANPQDRSCTQEEPADGCMPCQCRSTFGAWRAHRRALRHRSLLSHLMSMIQR